LQDLPTGLSGWKQLSCHNFECYVPGEFPRYLAVLDEQGEVVSREYAIGTYYVKVYRSESGGHCSVYRLEGLLLLDEVEVERAIWLNVENTDATLTRLRTLLTFA